MSNIFPTDFTNKTTLVAWDKVLWYDSVWLTNNNFTILAIYNYIIATITTTNVAEGTNLYYTEARVTANTTVAWLWTTKADKTNVIEKDSTTVYTPTANYHPANKLYVDSYVPPSATTSIEWVSIRATSAEAVTWTDTAKHITPETLTSRVNNFLSVSTKALTTIYQATKNGILIWSFTDTAWWWVITALSDAATPPTVVRAKTIWWSSWTQYRSFSIPVIKDHYYQVTTSGWTFTVTDIYFYEIW